MSGISATSRSAIGCSSRTAPQIMVVGAPSPP
jgi:hypothetical protein